MLPNGIISKSVAFDILPIIQSGSILVDCSTIDVAFAKEINQIASDNFINFINFLDAPVSGGVIEASSGSLNFMVGGEKNIYNKLITLFEVMGQKSVFCCSASSGQSAKICNNMILGVTMIATCEAFALVENLGLDRQEIYDVVSTSLGSSWSMNTYCPAKVLAQLVHLIMNMPQVLLLI
jgi:3-hydroxyisobutyrate dehydrogenase